MDCGAGFTVGVGFASAVPSVLSVTPSKAATLLTAAQKRGALTRFLGDGSDACDALFSTIASSFVGFSELLIASFCVFEASFAIDAAAAAVLTFGFFATAAVVLDETAFFFFPFWGSTRFLVPLEIGLRFAPPSRRDWDF